MADAATAKDQGIEYSVYTFEQSKDPSSQSKWHKQDTQTDMALAINSAEKLFGSGKFAKVEVKQKYFDKKQNRNVDVTLKVFESTKQKSEVNVLVILLFAIACGAAAFTATLYLSH